MLATIAPISFSFFDGSTKQYQTVSTDSIFVTILPAITKMDSAKISVEVGNGKYIWIVLCIAIIAAIILWLTFFKSTRRVALITEIKQAISTPIITKTTAEKLSDLQFIEEGNPFFEAVKELVTTLLLTEKNSLKITEIGRAHV